MVASALRITCPLAFAVNIGDFLRALIGRIFEGDGIVAELNYQPSQVDVLGGLLLTTEGSQIDGNVIDGTLG